MSASEVVSAYEAHLITVAEALEQALARDLDDLYRRAERERRRSGGSHAA